MALHLLKHCTHATLRPPQFCTCCSIARLPAALHPAGFGTLPAVLHPLNCCSYCIIALIASSHPLYSFAIVACLQPLHCCTHHIIVPIALLHSLHHCTHCVVAPVALLYPLSLHSLHCCTHCTIEFIASLHPLQSCTPCVVASSHPLHRGTRCTLAPVALCPPRALHPRPAPSRCSLPDAQEAIELELRTDSADGLLLWHGAVSRGTRLGRPPGEEMGTSPPCSLPPRTRRRTAKPKTSWGSA